MIAKRFMNLMRPLGEVGATPLYESLLAQCFVACVRFVALGELQ